MKFKLILYKEFDIDTDTEWGGDLTGLIEKLQSMDFTGTVEALKIQDAIHEMLGEDIEYVVDLDLDETCFRVIVPPDTTIEVPTEEETD